MVGRKQRPAPGHKRRRPVAVVSFSTVRGHRDSRHPRWCRRHRLCVAAIGAELALAHSANAAVGQPSRCWRCRRRRSPARSGCRAWKGGCWCRRYRVGRRVGHPHPGRSPRPSSRRRRIDAVVALVGDHDAAVVGDAVVRWVVVDAIWAPVPGRSSPRQHRYGMVLPSPLVLPQRLVTVLRGVQKS